VIVVHIDGAKSFGGHYWDGMDVVVYDNNATESDSWATMMTVLLIMTVVLWLHVDNYCCLDLSCCWYGDVSRYWMPTGMMMMMMIFWSSDDFA
jgi:hypothetical protein